MNLNFRQNIVRNIKLQSFLVLSIVLFLIKIFLILPDTFTFKFITELVVILVVISLSFYLLDLMTDKNLNAISLVINIGILDAVIFFLMNFSSPLVNLLLGSNPDSSNFLYRLISFIYSYLIIISISFIFLSFRELYFLKRGKRVTTYFNTMTVFFVLFLLSTVLNDFKSLSYIKDTFYVISILLIAINSAKISWIAFLSKRDKIKTLLLSVVIEILFVADLIGSSGTNFHSQIFINFSPALDEFLQLLMIYGIIYFGVLFFTTLFHIPTAEAFDRKQKEVSSLQYFSKLITQVLDFNDLTKTITEIGLSASGADAAWIITEGENEFDTIAIKNIGFVDAKTLTEYILEKIKTTKIKSTSIFNLKDFKKKENITEKFSSMSVTPLKSHNYLRGFLVTAKKEGLGYDEEDIRAIDTFCDYASVSIENSRLLEESIEKERLEKELDLARQIQRKIIPAKNPESKRLDISSVFIPAFEVGGDYYDFFEISDSKMAFVIADVSGKGISAAFIMAEIKGIFESLSKTIESPKEILIKANQILKGILDNKNFVSAAYGLFDFNNKTLTLARAGHCPILLLRNNEYVDIRPSGLGLGLDYGGRFKETLDEVTMNLHENDTFVLYTDGVSEAKNAEMEDFGEMHFRKILLNNANKESNEISNSVIKEISLFSRNNQQYDDITLVILKWKQENKIDGEKEWQNSTPRLKTTVK